MVDIWREQAAIRFGSVDRSDRLTLAGIFNFFQEASISHAEDLGVGRDSMEKTGQAWVLSRFSLFVERRPAYGETVEISTWPRRWEKLFALRDCMIRDARGNAAVRGRSAWLVLDIEKRRPLRAQAVMENLPANDGIDAFPPRGNSASPIGLEPAADMVKVSERNALYSDIDYYGHANNARYIQWIQDAADANILTGADQFRLDINYLSEVLPGETVELWATRLTNGGTEHTEHAGARSGDQKENYPSPPCITFAFEGRRPQSAQPVFRAELFSGGHDVLHTQSR